MLRQTWGTEAAGVGGSASWGVAQTWLSQEVATSMLAVGLKHMLEMLSSGGDVTSVSLLGLKFGWEA